MPAETTSRAVAPPDAGVGDLASARQEPLSPPLPAESLAAVTVVIVNHNADRLLIDCLDSVLLQAREVVVVDNASDADRFEPLIAGVAAHPRLQVIRSAVNRGFAAGCNLGAELSTQPLVLFLNPDCILTAGSLARMVAALADNPRAAMAGGLLTYSDGSEQGGGRRAVPTPWRSFVRGFGLARFSHRWPKLFDDFHLHRQPLPAGPISVEAISGACMLVARDAIDDFGLMDEHYFLHCEDLDLCMRARQHGWQILFVPDAPVVHHKGGCSRDKPLFVEWHKHRGMVRFYRKHFRHQYPGALMHLVTLGVWLRFAGIVARRQAGLSLQYATGRMSAARSRQAASAAAYEEAHGRRSPLESAVMPAVAASRPLTS